MLQPPSHLRESAPKRGFAEMAEGFVPPPRNRTQIRLAVPPGSERLQLLEPFPPWDRRDFLECPVLLKVRGPCTTDHISPAGPWLRFRGHLDRISDNMLTGATNAFTGETGRTADPETGERDLPVPAVARAYRERDRRWVVVGDANYGEGSSREHAAMSPRHLGAAAVIARSFARIHETNLKKQGLLPLTFVDPEDYERIREDDRLAIVGLESIAPGRPVKMIIRHADGAEESIELRHTFSAEQLEYFRAGSALNLLSRRGERGGAAGRA